MIRDLVTLEYQSFTVEEIFSLSREYLEELEDHNEDAKPFLEVVLRASHYWDAWSTYDSRIHLGTTMSIFVNDTRC